MLVPPISAILNLSNNNMSLLTLCIEVLHFYFDYRNYDKFIIKKKKKKKEVKSRKKTSGMKENSGTT